MSNYSVSRLNQEISEQTDQIECRTCHAKPGEPCTYIAPEPRPFAYADSYFDRLARTGTPTKRPHNERRSQARNLVKRRIQAQQKRDLQASIKRPSKTQLQIAQAQQQFLLQEHEQMRAFLTAFGTIFDV